MTAACHHLWPVAFVAILLVGCQASPSKLAALESQNRALAEQNRAQLAEIENLKVHARGVQDKLLSAEAELARLDKPQAGVAAAAPEAEPPATSAAETASPAWTARPN